MAMRVLIVDDSAFFRKALKEVLTADGFLEVVGEAVNGREAIDKAARLEPDVITMDVEMPVMDGISAVREIMKAKPTPILMLSALTQAGAEATLDALDAGAVDFWPKDTTDPKSTLHQSARLLRARLRTLAVRGVPRKARAPLVPPSASTAGKVERGSGLQAGDLRGVISRRGMVVIGASTGGPAALQIVLERIPAGFPVPVLIAQHMPAAFTGPFAQRLDAISGLKISEAVDGEPLLPGHAYVIPGGVHGEVIRQQGQCAFRRREPAANEHYRPSVSIALASAAMVYGADTLGVVLTGMGDDGAQGARMVRDSGGHVWSQDQASCVIYGMPAAVAKAGLSEAVLPLGQIGDAIAGCVR
ncbi:MAG: protein-glutamate methylesterase/protein-glutamine glutaminase [Halothiobacillaceae bacterium]